MKSILNVNISFKAPYITSTIPFNGGTSGIPFCIETQDSVTNFDLVCEGASYGYPLNTSFIESDSDNVYFNAGGDIVSYLDGLGYTIRSGRYYFKITLDNGNVYYTGLFRLETLDEAPTSIGDYSQDFSNDFAI